MRVLKKEGRGFPHNETAALKSPHAIGRGSNFVCGLQHIMPTHAFDARQLPIG